MDFVVHSLLQLYLLLLFGEQKQSDFTDFQGPEFLVSGLPFLSSSKFLLAWSHPSGHAVQEAARNKHWTLL